MKNRCSALQVANDVTLYHVGPALDHGPLPSLFYFAISGPDSLCLDPYNQIVQFLAGHMIRIFSMTLPGHENGLPAEGAMKIWAEDFLKGRNCIETFLQTLDQAIDFAIREKFVDPTKLACAGLSRGGFIASHLAARDTRFRYLLFFSPLTKLSAIKEFKGHPNLALASQLDVIHLADSISDRHIRLYIGNDDTRVGTRHCFDYAMKIVEKKKTRSAHVELVIYPSIGQMGHGTPPEIFSLGADWIRTLLLQ
ncbi:MAG: hypothetical protein A3D96_01770 [Chlamydiae bacterium RIFCSPHIGHO2_12_FULL_44_59]|nr:MAG: hypothetical protein A2796_05605 [Chlamydiae bacterium RIFCSPHIGHO2_01_FULL_44_39]OGN60895.1 MAG: hypothetical protein A3D96_01770 [Chlamydiae bacterium RIFCSPHIGHO2_12_FULL_44_59]OGN66481.1 MAG: hypothetical protein A2978_01390 [Chlamydiae bacterium RIFCSPLOWO2_01_FULL_44_52]OGN69944.1 MAG: hypothetical protein A3I67_01380 [Chlamydiae bacterium RIFCSPLOWO2_02_FULL_45_22]OGN71015.1 MAG: hypothetical protein A3F79_05455 [Chlamydiae bacterium RIFCSPLOWO2_12_FULL_45_20]